MKGDVRAEADGDGGHESPTHAPAHSPSIELPIALLQVTESFALKLDRTRMLDAAADVIRRIEQRLERDRNWLHDYYRTAVVHIANDTFDAYSPACFAAPRLG